MQCLYTLYGWEYDYSSLGEVSVRLKIKCLYQAGTMDK